MMIITMHFYWTIVINNAMQYKFCWSQSRIQDSFLDSDFTNSNLKNACNKNESLQVCIRIRELSEALFTKSVLI